MDSFKECAVCFVSFDTQNHVPRSLPCGHTLCSQCLKDMLSLPHLRKCPFDNQPFTSISVDSFPLIYALFPSSDQKHKETCKIHGGEKLKLVCLVDGKKLCLKCVASGEHNGHKIETIKELKIQGAKVKRELESTLSQLEIDELNKENDCETIKKKFISTIDEQYKKVKDIMVNIFDKDEKNDIFVFRQQIDETIKDLTHACQDEGGDLILLEKVISNAKALLKFFEKNSFKGNDKVLKMQKSLEQSLKDQTKIVDALQFSSPEIVKEIESGQEEMQELSKAELSNNDRIVQPLRFLSYFDVKKVLEAWIFPQELINPERRK